MRKTTTSARKPKKKADWSKIKAEWVEGFETIRGIARLHGVSDAAIRKKAKAERWPDYGVGQKAKCEPQPKQREPEQKRTEVQRDTAPIITRSADADPKELVKSGREIIEMLMRELRVFSQNLDVIEQIIEEETVGDKSPKRRQFLQRMVSLPVRAQAAKNLASALATLKEAAPGKKEAAKDEAESVGNGADNSWGDDLNPFAAGKPN